MKLHYLQHLGSVFRSSGERAAWLLLCSWVHWVEDDESRCAQALWAACEALRTGVA